MTSAGSHAEKHTRLCVCLEKERRARRTRGGGAGGGQADRWTGRQTDRQVGRQLGSAGQWWSSQGLPPACIIDVLLDKLLL